jgi:hypothetical protein
VICISDFSLYVLCCVLDIPNPFVVDLKSEAELGQFVHEQYEGVLVKGLGMETAVQTLISVSLHFMNQSNTASPRVSFLGLALSVT